MIYDTWKALTSGRECLRALGLTLLFSSEFLGTSTFEAPSDDGGLCLWRDRSLIQRGNRSSAQNVLHSAASALHTKSMRVGTSVTSVGQHLVALQLHSCTNKHIRQAGHNEFTEIPIIEQYVAIIGWS